MTDYVQPAPPGFEELVVPAFPDLDEMLEYLNAVEVDNSQLAKILASVFALSVAEAMQVFEYWRALPKESKKEWTDE
jgi:hypothetical protein